MKRILLLMLMVAGLLASCDYDNPIDKDLSDELDEIMVTPSSLEFYLDTESPRFSVICVPSYAKDTTVTWSSSHPLLVEVNPVTGEVTLLKSEPTQVYITATSRDGGHTSSCMLNLHMMPTPMDYYEPMDLRKDFGLWILDRSIGEATSVGGKGNKFYQWGRNIPCGSAKGDIYWKADPSNDLFSDWTDPLQTLAPKGWRLPTKAELEVIGAKINKTDDMGYDEQRRAEMMLAKLKLLSEDKGAGTDYFRYGPFFQNGVVIPAYGFDAWYGMDNFYWPSSDRVLPEDQEGNWPQVYALRINKNGSAKMEKMPVCYATAIRCVRK